jgi:hypothetical protein
METLEIAKPALCRGQFALDPANPTILVGLETENSRDLQQLQFLELLVSTWIRTDSKVGQHPGTLHGRA